jgi:hypothetical protein
METKEEYIQLQPASLGRVLKRGFADAYDRLGLTVASSLLWSIVVMLPLAIGWGIQRRYPASSPWLIICGLIIGILISSPIMAGVFKMAQRIVYRDDPSLRDIIEGAREFLASGFALILLNIVVLGMFVVDIAFFAGLFGPLRDHRFLPAMFFVSYLLLGWLMMMLYQMPALAAQKPLGQKEGVLSAVKKSFLLMSHNPGFTTGLFVVILGFSILCAVSGIGMLVLYIGTASIVQTHALRELFIRYGVVENVPDTVKDVGWKLD